MFRKRFSPRFLPQFIPYLLLLLLLLAAGMMTGCHKDTKKDDLVAPEASSTHEKGATQEIDDIMMEHLVNRAIRNMSLAEKVGQLFIVCTDSLDFNAETALTGQAAKNLEKYHPGGVIFFSFNLQNREQTTRFLADLQSHSKLPLFLAVDEEGGNVARVANNEELGASKLPPMSEIGAGGDPEKAREAGETIGADLSSLGFNLDFAPVADVVTNEANTEIGNRSFGSDPDLVSDMVCAFIKGLHIHHVCATLKHFPGQGDSGDDTHKGYVNLDTSIDRLREVEFVPFENGIKAGTDLIMVSHVSVSNITQNEVPASLSPLIVTDILRGELSFDGIIVTDAMNMKVITKFYDPAQAAILAVEAGDDMILMPDNFETAYQGVLEAVKEGELSEKKINAAVRRILTAKLRQGIIPLDSEVLQGED